MGKTIGKVGNTCLQHIRPYVAAAYQAKAWIDMLGYRLFKVLGSALILVLAYWLPLGSNAAQLSWLTLLICATWFIILVLLAREYHAALERQQTGT